MSGDFDGGPGPLGPREKEQLEPDLVPESELNEAALDERGPAAASSPTLRAHLTPYYTPPPAAENTRPRAKPLRRRAAVGAIIAAVGLGLAAGHFLGPGFGLWTFSREKAEKTLLVSDPDLDLKATERLQHLLAEPSATAAPVPTPDPNHDPQSVLSAANAESLIALAQDVKGASQESQKVAKGLQEGKRKLYRVHVLDFLAQDGDEVELFVDGVSFGSIPLYNAGKDVLIPLARGTSSQMRIVATRDGGGGVTFGLVSSMDKVMTRVMQVGDSEQWWVTVK